MTNGKIQETVKKLMTNDEVDGILKKLMFTSKPSLKNNDFWQLFSLMLVPRLFSSNLFYECIQSLSKRKFPYEFTNDCDLPALYFSLTQTFIAIS
jgi:hypothetical protein